MTPHGFSHLYELFATFTLAYIIIDELTENPFVSLISEKILKKYTVIDTIFSEIKSKIQGYKISIKSIKQLNPNEDIIIKGLPKNELILESIEIRVLLFFDKIHKRIRRNYTTKIFVYLNCYLLLYCLAMLFFGGLYEEIPGVSPTKIAYDLNLANSLFLFFTCSFLFLLIGWFIDKQNIKQKNKNHSSNSNKEEDDDNKHEPNSFLIENGYYISGLYFILIVILSISTYIFHWTFGVNLDNEKVHQTLVVCSVFLPLSNFIIYFIKANKRANKCLPELKRISQENKEQYLLELEAIEDFIRTCNYIKKSQKIEIIEEDNKK